MVLLGAAGGMHHAWPFPFLALNCPWKQTDKLSAGLGHIATQLASRGFGLRVIGIDSGSKKDIVMESGAEHFIDFTACEDVAQEVKDLTGGLGAHACVVLTAANGAYAM